MTASDPFQPATNPRSQTREHPKLSIAETISSAFQKVLADPALTDDQIKATKDPMELPDRLPLIDVVPCFMLYCAKYPEDDSLVAYFTVNALAEYGRAKDSDNDYLNFKFKCDDHQKDAVAAFLIWAKGAPNYEDEDQIDRALRRWR
jgi:hypothetical protein